MVYIKNLERPINLKLGDIIGFTLSDGSTYRGKVTGEPFFITMYDYNNSIIFDKLNLESRSFVKDIVGYYVKGNWPEVNSLEELSKVLDVLFKVNKEEFTDEIKPTHPSEWDWLF